MLQVLRPPVVVAALIQFLAESPQPDLFLLVSRCNWRSSSFQFRSTGPWHRSHFIDDLWSSWNKVPCIYINMRKSNTWSGFTAFKSCQSKYFKVKCHGQSLFIPQTSFQIWSSCPNTSPIALITPPKTVTARIPHKDQPLPWRSACHLVSSRC